MEKSLNKIIKNNENHENKNEIQIIHVGYDKQIYGHIIYDTQLDQIYFKNINGEKNLLTSGTRKIDFSNLKKSNDTPNSNIFIYMNDWDSTKEYTIGNVVIYNHKHYLCISHQNYNHKVPPYDKQKWKVLNNPIFMNHDHHCMYDKDDIIINNDHIYISLIDQNTFEINNNIYWKKLMNNYIHIWNEQNIYHIDDIVYNTNDHSIYKKIKIDEQNSSKPPQENPIIWELCNHDNTNQKKMDELLNTINTIQTNNGLFFGIFMNNIQLYKYDITTEKSVINELSINESSIHFSEEEYKKKEIIIKNKIEPIYFELVGNNDSEYFDYIDCSKTIHIIKIGFYKVTYNIS